MIRISLGKVGSGKTANEVRELVLNKARRKTYSNIKTTLTNQIDLKSDMIFKKELVKTIKKRSGDTEAVYDYKLNIDFWKKIKEPINICIDEAHTFYNSRRSLSKKNLIAGDFLALIRKILGSNSTGYGEFILITQNLFKLDVQLRDSANQFRYHICHYKKTCSDCGTSWNETSEMAEPLWVCPRCDNVKIKKHNHFLEIWHFSSMDNYLLWEENHENSFYRHYIVNDIEKYFGLYDTLSFDDLTSD